SGPAVDLLLITGKDLQHSQLTPEPKTLKEKLRVIFLSFSHTRFFFFLLFLILGWFYNEENISIYRRDYEVVGGC
ncbi:unnamed protein product, partial [Arabidopsis halleri]